MKTNVVTDRKLKIVFDLCVKEVDRLKIEFYDDYFSIKPFSEVDEGNRFKDCFIRNRMKNGKIYKFVAFTAD